MGRGAYTGVIITVIFIILLLVMIGDMIEVFMVGAYYPDCFEFSARYLIQIAAEYSIYSFLLASWFAYKESSRILAVFFMCSMFLIGSISSMGYILLQISKLSPEEFAKDPIYFVLARRHKRDGIKGPPVMAARILFCVLTCYIVGVTAYTVFMDIFHTPTINKCLLPNIIDIYTQYIALSVWIAYKELSWTNAFIWVSFVMLFRSIALCIYIAKELFYLSPDQPVSLILFNNKNRNLEASDPLLKTHPSE